VYSSIITDMKIYMCITYKLLSIQLDDSIGHMIDITNYEAVDVRLFPCLCLQ